MTPIFSSRTLTLTRLAEPRRPMAVCMVALALAATAAGWPALARATEQAPAHGAVQTAPEAAASEPSPTASSVAPKSIKELLREAIKNGVSPEQRLQLVIESKKGRTAAPPIVSAELASPAHADSPAAPTPSSPKPRPSRQHTRARTAAMVGHESAPSTVHTEHGGEVHWSYTGETGPQAWGNLKPEFAACATGKRQSPINIEEPATLQGPAEPLVFHYQPSSGSVVNNGHTIQVDLQGENTLTVRGSTFRLVQFHFHMPSEERINQRSSAMVTHLVHKNAQDELAVVSVLLEPGVANALINKVWTHMPLDAGDRVPLPVDLIDLNELLPKDQRYYQFIGSLTTPPCTEGVLWMVFKQPTTVSIAQIKLFGQIFPNNARPVQAVNGRSVRNAL